ncbi:lipopolysaccharide biosynthesis protein [Mucilaginibacter sp. Bleaf8]|uniref:Wzz/FepE/Etk N-terminal domain-containing protein n=1 Tax=Mucilaginibacter sp. Bleaf8 TaxID=2834430 RepID=UPI001BCCC250|nr:Wzz/FepE/Etk N-terminal domain-containing protein [Mucilaginibacter sp. Bleaf8]MBS7562849.1 lipopolysaccharide biosynthesis protein [Mucilaginibacter sp. Bleaf8]
MQEHVVRDQDDITLKELIVKINSAFSFLLRQWKIILVVTIIGAVLGVFYANYKKPVYTAQCSFVLEDNSNKTNVGVLSGFASLIGGGATSNTGIFQGDNILELYTSRLMIEKTLLSPVTIEGKKQLLIDRYIDINKLREKWVKDKDLKNISFEIGKPNFTLKHDSIVSKVVDDIKGNYLTVERPDKSLNIIDVSVACPDQYYAKEFADRIVENVNAFYVDTRTKRSQENIRMLQLQADSIRTSLNSSMGRVAVAQDANPNPNPAMQSLRITSQRRQVDVQSNQAIYVEVIHNLELAKMALKNERPIIQVIDGPVYPLPVKKLSPIKGAVIAGILAMFFCVIILVTRKFLVKVTAS